MPVVLERSQAPRRAGRASGVEAPSRFDVALVSARPGTKVAPAGVRSLVRYLVAADVIVSPRELPGGGDDGVTEVHAAPGSYAHSIFRPGPADPATTPAFRELVLRFGSTPVPLGYGEAGPQVPVYFALEFRGCAFDFVHQRLMDRLYQVLYLRAAVFARATPSSREGDAPGEDGGPAARRPGAPHRRQARTHAGGVGTTVDERD